MNVTILYSGGLDSLIMYHVSRTLKVYKDANVKALWFDLGQSYNYKEEAALPYFVERRNIDWLNVGGDSSCVKGKGTESGQIFIPGRNAVLITAAACMTLADEVWLGALLGETHDKATDKNNEFLNRIQSTLSYALSPFRENLPPVGIKFPLAGLGLNKYTSVALAITTGLPIEAILNTSSCLSGEPGNCGKCVVCFRRWGIFTRLGFSESYNVDPLSQPENLAILDDMFKMDTSYYDNHRKSEILPALNPDFVESRYGASAKQTWELFCSTTQGYETRHLERLTSQFF